MNNHKILESDEAETPYLEWLPVKSLPARRQPYEHGWDYFDQPLASLDTSEGQTGSLYDGWLINRQHIKAELLPWRSLWTTVSSLL